jgi:hypothetical protein
MATPTTPKRITFTATGYEHPKVGAIRDLAVYRASDGALYSTWRLSWKERLAVLFGKPVVVGTLAHKVNPMTVLVGEDMIPTEDA